MYICTVGVSVPLFACPAYQKGNHKTENILKTMRFEIKFSIHESQQSK